MANREGGGTAATNVATVPWMTSLQDTASNLQQASPAADGTTMTMTKATTATPAASPIPQPFLGRVVPPAPILPFTSMPRVSGGGFNLNPVASSAAEPAPSTVSRVVQTNAFKHCVAVVCVFVISLVVLIVIQPPFTYTKSKEKYKRGHFSVGIAALYALGSACLAAGVMTGVYFASRKTGSRAKLTY